MKHVLVTGATGYVASQMLPVFRKRFELSLIDYRSQDSAGRLVEGVKTIDLLNDNQLACSNLLDGVDTVVHLALARKVPGGSVKGGVPDPPVMPSVTDNSSPEIDEFYSERPNVRMTYNVLSAAFEAGVKRFVFASSNRTVDWYEHTMIHDRKVDMLTEGILPLSDIFYGWSKASCERLSFLFANGSLGRKMEIVNIRIGWPHDLDVREFSGNVANYKRALATNFSADDVARMFVAAIEKSDIANSDGIPWQTIYGVSDNSRRFWSLANARSSLDYDPQNDSEIKYKLDIDSFILKENPNLAIGKVNPLPH